MRLIFHSRLLGNEPTVTIEASDVEHLLMSRYFKVYTYDAKYKIVVNDSIDVVKMVDVHNPNDSGIVIGYINKIT